MGVSAEVLQQGLGLGRRGSQGDGGARGHRVTQTGCVALHCSEGAGLLE